MFGILQVNLGLGMLSSSSCVLSLLSITSSVPGSVLIGPTPPWIDEPGLNLSMLHAWAEPYLPEPKLGLSKAQRSMSQASLQSNK